MHSGTKNAKIDNMNGITLYKIKEEKGLGVIISNSVPVSENRAQAIKV